MGLFLYLLILLILVTIIWKISSIARYYIKFIIFGIVTIAASCAPIPIMLLSPRASKNALMPSAGFRLCGKLIGLKVTVQGHENIVQNSGCVVLTNHQSFLDIIVVGYLWPIMPNCTVIAKKEILYLQPFGLASWLWGTIFIDRLNVKEARNSVNKTADYIRNNQGRVLIFPEGTRNYTKKLLPFKKGAFHLAVASKCPIQPVAVSRYTFLGNQRFDDGEIRIKILPPISTESKTQDNLQEIIDEVYEVMSKNVDILSNSQEESISNGKIKPN